jgi:lipopolysaccharide transport protein LptA
VTASTYISIAAVSIVAASSWLVQIVNDAHVDSAKNLDLHRVPHFPERRNKSTTQAEPAAKLDHVRYGGLGPESDSPPAQGVPFRSMGARMEPRARAPQPEVNSYEGRSLNELPEIVGTIDQGTPAEPIFDTVTPESGYHINADEADKVGSKSEKIIFKGHVTLTSPTFNLVADQLIMHMGKDGEAFKKAEALGSVKVQLVGVPVEKRYRGQSEAAVYNPSAGSLVMSGWPKIQGDGQEIVASASDTKITLYPATGKMNTEGRAQTRVARHFVEGAGAKN